MGVTGWALRTALARIPWARLGQPGARVRGMLERVQSILYADTRRQVDPRNPYGYAGSVLMGVVFAAGWSPCIGPILGSILTVSANATTGSDWLGAGGMLLVYSLGLGVPFLLAAVAIDQMRGLMKRIQRRMRLVEVFSGSFLIFMGVLLYTGELARLAQAGGSFADFTYNLQECTIGVISGEVQISEYGTCMELGPNFRIILERRERGAQPGDASGAPLIGAPPPADMVPTPSSDEALTTRAVGLDVGLRAPNFTVPVLEGEPVELFALRGRVVLLNFWATWCGPCREEMPFFQRLEDTYAAEGFTVLAVNYAEPPDAVRGFMEQEQLRFSAGLDQVGAVNRQFGVRGYPTTYIIGRDGVILARQTGPFEVAALEAAIIDWLAAAP
jgi:cytochrome c-type biogenesis protein